MKEQVSVNEFKTAEEIVDEYLKRNEFCYIFESAGLEII